MMVQREQKREWEKENESCHWTSIRNIPRNPVDLFSYMKYIAAVGQPVFRKGAVYKSRVILLSIPIVFQGEHAEADHLLLRAAAYIEKAQGPENVDLGYNLLNRAWALTMQVRTAV